jgi:hypothetical protein
MQNQNQQGLGGLEPLAARASLSGDPDTHARDILQLEAG